MSWIRALYLVTLDISLKNWFHRCGYCAVALCLIWCSTVTGEILNNFIFDPVFYKSRPMKQWSMHKSGGAMCNMRVFIPMSLYLHTAYMMPPCTQNSRGPMTCGRSARVKASTKQACFLSVTKLFQMQKEAMAFQETQMTKKPYHILSYFPVLANHLCWKWWHRRKGKDGNW